MSAISVPQILCINGECNFLFLILLTIGLCNFSANYLLEIILFLIVTPEDFSSKNLLAIKVSPHWYPSFFEFLPILNYLLHNTLSATILLFQFLKSP